MAQIYVKSVILCVPSLLIVAATQAEISPLLNRFKIKHQSNEGIITLNTGYTFHLLITGVGMVNTAYSIGRYVRQTYDLAINVGICGAFNRTLALGQVVNVTHDCISEMGAEDGDAFIPYPDLGLGGTHVFKNRQLGNYSFLSQLPSTKGITVNKVHGNSNSINNIQALYAPAIESMEGAAFFATSTHHSTEYLQLRAISNYIEKRDRSKWDIALAVKNLNVLLLQLIDELNP